MTIVSGPGSFTDGSPNEVGAVLVTGGAGFVGATLVRDLVDDGVRVGVYDNWANASSTRLPTDASLEVFEGDIRDEARVRKAIEVFEPDVVVHLAAIHFIPHCNAYPEECWDVNTLGTLRLMAALPGTSVRRVVVASTAAVYPVQDGPCREDGPIGPIDVYGASKLACEALANRLAVEDGITAIAARLFNVFGPGETNPHVIPEIIEQIAVGEELRLGNLEARRDYVHVRDVSEALRTLSRTPASGFSAFNVGTGRAWSVSDVLEILGDGLGAQIDVVQDERRVRRVDRPLLVADPSRTAAVTGWTASTDFRDGLLELLDHDMALRP
jgi:UDP-glucose 4-epimerase